MTPESPKGGITKRDRCHPLSRTEEGFHFLCIQDFPVTDNNICFFPATGEPIPFSSPGICAAQNSNNTPNKGLNHRKITVKGPQRIKNYNNSLLFILLSFNINELILFINKVFHIISDNKSFIEYPEE